MIPYQEPSWLTIADSPTVLATRELLMLLNERIADVSGATNFEEPLNIRRYVRWDSAPLENIKEFLEFLGLPSGGFLGEEFERRIYRDLFELFQSRNYRAGLTLLEQEAEASITHWWTFANGVRIHLNLCVTPSALSTLTPDYAVGMSNWCRWLIEWWAENMSVFLCISHELEPVLRLSARHAISPPIARYFLEA